ncbi:hypothetical protein [Rothia nasimurium]|uniref:hypothetical protein n=1 Tax=Rothia nasimurium TaxID=85336 RepID=UPI001F292094|nr:hypothetical protein [Rothia nasimurium]
MSQPLHHRESDSEMSNNRRLPQARFTADGLSFGDKGGIPADLLGTTLKVEKVDHDFTVLTVKVYCSDLALEATGATYTVDARKGIE